MVTSVKTEGQNSLSKELTNNFDYHYSYYNVHYVALDNNISLDCINLIIIKYVKIIMKCIKWLGKMSFFINITKQFSKLFFILNIDITLKNIESQKIN